MSIDEDAQENMFDEVNKWLRNHVDDPNSLEKAKKYRALLHANRTLRSKLKKLKLLYEKKNAQYEAMKEALDLEKDLYDSDWATLLSSSPTAQEPKTYSVFSGLQAKMQGLSTNEEKGELFQKTLSKTIAMLRGVKEYAINGITTEDVMASCMEIFSKENPTVLFVPPAVVSIILTSVSEKIVFEKLNELKASEYNSCFFTFSDKSKVYNTHHWSLLLYTKNRENGSGIYHYDSWPERNREIARRFSGILGIYFNTQQFYEVRCVPQANAGESGLHVIENMTKLLPMLETGKIIVDNVEITLQSINLLKVFTMKCRVLVMKLYLQRKLELLREYFVSEN